MNIISPAAAPPDKYICEFTRMELLAISDGLGRLGVKNDDEERYGEPGFTHTLWKQTLRALGLWEHA